MTSTVTGTPVSTTGARVYAVTFQQVRYCGQYNIMPWAVTIDGLTAVQPSNQTLPLPTNYFSTRVSDQNLTRITLFVPPGTYDYTLSGGAEMGGGFYPTSGTVVISGSDVVVLSLIESQQPTDADFAAKRDQIRDSLLQAKQQERFGLFIANLVDEMTKAGKIKRNEDALKNLGRSGSESGM